MKNLFLSLAALCIVLGCSRQPSFKINGSVAGIDGKAVLAYENPVSKTKISDTVVITGGKFEFCGTVEEPVYGTITVICNNDAPVKAGICIENSDLDIVLDWSSIIDQGRYGKYLAKTMVTGGTNNTFINEYNAISDSIKNQEKYREYSVAYKKIDSLASGTDREAYKAAVTEFRSKYAKEMGEISEETQKACLSFIKANPDIEAAAAMSRYYMSGMSLPELEELYGNFTPKVQNSNMAKELKEEVEALKAVQPGAMAPDFTLKTPDGTDFTLSSLRGKYVLIDFWASWCGPCRASIPHLKEIYAKYKDKDFEIVGVTNDTNHDAWKKAIEEDKSPWIHVADVFPDNRGGEIIGRYAAHFLPTLFLIDKEGKMIGKIEHTALEEKLEELLK